MKSSPSPLLPLLFFLLASASLVSAHGFLSSMTIDGTFYRAPVPNRDPGQSIIRQVRDIGPVQGASNPDINCGLGAPPAPLVADANPGSTVAFNWSGGEFQRWPHNTGPMLTYMANCGSAPCNEFDAGKARWFKIEQIARRSDGAWAQNDLQAGGHHAIILPSALAPGNYLIRHEIIALHNGVARGGAEFYPACAQLRVGGSQKGAPTDNELVSFPGAYSDDDPGIFYRQAYDSSAQYTFPGPPVAAFVGTGSSEAGEGAAVPTATATATGTGGGPGTKGGYGPSYTSAYQAPTPTTQCRLKRNMAAVKREQQQQGKRAAGGGGALVRRHHDLAVAIRSLFSGKHRRS